ncbi:MULTISPECIES: universal stress protein [unclassified Achromobacter]|uniref:universal stress protein n=1 Tax=unclassified Achromobacter TaxID=2626865 RepID=UPI000B51AB52|nr:MULTISPECIES: universal stress protein [unclassified Achromobacter]OWT75653.1 universal stress protein [Achromobacter sp. HZ28]OWT76314.1 universal stress protein [Achromobacter sp. HZ34]
MQTSVETLLAAVFAGADRKFGAGGNAAGERAQGGTVAGGTVLRGPILLATDLSARCDRALDRAILLARQFDVPLLAVHVLSPPHSLSLGAPVPTDVTPLVQQAEARLLRDLDGLVDGIQVAVRVCTGEPAARLRQVAEDEKCALIVTGLARDETLGRMLLGTTVERLVRETSRPVLVVKRRARVPYQDAVVATDFSSGSRWALRAALALLPPEALTLFHAFELPRGPLRDTSPDTQTAKGFQRIAEESALDFVNATPELHGKPQPRCQVAAGRAERVVIDYVRQAQASLLVAGTHGTGGLTGALLGSVAEALLERAPSDVMVVRQPPAG